MKKILTFLCALLAVALFALAGCSSKKLTVVPDEDGNAQSVIVYADDGVLKLTDKTTFGDYLIALDGKGRIELEYENGDYGMFISGVNGVKNKTISANEGYSWMVYTSLKTLDGVIYSSEEYGTYEKDGLKLYSAMYGADGLPMLEGYAYALVYSRWAY